MELPGPSELQLQAEAAEKWRIANAGLGILRQSLQIVEGVGFDSHRFDMVVDSVENYLPKAISHSDLPESVQMDFLGLLSLEGRRKDVLRNYKRRGQVIGMTIWLMQFGIRVLEYLKVTVHGLPVRQYLTRDLKLEVGDTVGNSSMTPVRWWESS